MSQKPPPMFSRFESIKVFVTPRMLKGLLLVLFVFVAPSGVERVLRPEIQKAAPIPLPVPAQEWTTAEAGLPFRWPVLGALPPPDPRQRKPPCVLRMGEESINGVCWLRLDIRPPCPKDADAYAFEHEGKCYAYALRAERPKQSGEPTVVNIAAEE